MLTLVILAAGSASRFGSLKQLEPVGPDGESILDYSLFDAQRGGFEKVVFVVRRDTLDQFQLGIGTRFANRMEVAYAVQSIDDVSVACSVDASRTKPWGTAHALLAAEAEVSGPFAVANADDLYGPDAFAALASLLLDNHRLPESDFAMIGYRLEDTLSDEGPVCRAVCTVDSKNYLTDIVEVQGLEVTGGPAKSIKDDRGHVHDAGSIVSMNTWGFRSAVFPLLKDGFRRFLSDHGQSPHVEFQLPAGIMALIRSKNARVLVARSSNTWCGLTHPKDKASVVRSIRALIERGVYPKRIRDHA